MIINPCPKCGSEDISITGLSWIQVNCNSCNHLGQPFSYGTRCDRYDEAIRAWNEERPTLNQVKVLYCKCCMTDVPYIVAKIDKGPHKFKASCAVCSTFIQWLKVPNSAEAPTPHQEKRKSDAE